MPGTLNLLLPIEFLVTGGFWWVLFKCLLVCPGIPILLELITSSRFVPLKPSRFQFWAFFPGNPFLALFIALCSTAIPESGHVGFWQSVGVQQALLVAAFVIYVALNVMDLFSNYTKEQMASPFKIWHNALYFWYGYLAFAMTLVLWSSTEPWPVKLAKTLPGLFWLGCLIKDSFFTTKEELEVKFQTAHSRWNPLWKTKRILRMQRSRLGTYFWD